MNELLTVEGTRHCGAIQVTARVDRGLVMACHCTDCQTIGGGPFEQSPYVIRSILRSKANRKGMSKLLRAAINVSRLSAVTVEHSCCACDEQHDKNLISVLVFESIKSINP